MCGELLAKKYRVDIAEQAHEGGSIRYFVRLLLILANYNIVFIIIARRKSLHLIFKSRKTFNAICFIELLE